MNKKDLKGCPFCGEKPEYKDLSDMYRRPTFVFQCGNCGLEMFDITKKGLLSNWNTRFKETK